jgi:transposase
VGGRGHLGIGLGRRRGGTGRRQRRRHRGVVRRRHFHTRAKRGDEVGKTKVGKGIKIELVTDANGIPLGVVTAAANVPETDLIGPALDAIPEAIDLPDQVPVIADKAYDSDPLREELADDGFRLLSPHRKNRQRPPSSDGRRMRRYKRRWVVERTIGWLHSFRRLLVRHEYYSFIFDGFVHLALALITLSKF